jgi:hypothetical protein
MTCHQGNFLIEALDGGINLRGKPSSKQVEQDVRFWVLAQPKLTPLDESGGNTPAVVTQGDFHDGRNGLFNFARSIAGCDGYTPSVLSHFHRGR